jgi:hypothetical protein
VRLSMAMSAYNVRFMLAHVQARKVRNGKSLGLPSVAEEKSMRAAAIASLTRTHDEWP